MRMQHHYEVAVEWLGDRGIGTSSARSYSREHVVRIQGLPDIAGSADPTFHGDRHRHNPEQLLVAALAQCHMLSYLFQAARQGIVVTGYEDVASGTMETSGTGGRFTEVVLRPVVTITDAADAERALAAHAAASQDCFIAASVAFPVRHEPSIVVDGRIVAGRPLDEGTAR